MTLHMRQPLPQAPGYDRAPVAPASEVYAGFFKRVFDIVIVALGALPALLVVLPLMAIIAQDGRSPIYRQKRLGLNGRVFHIWKLRTMVPDADALLAAHLAADPEARAEWAHRQKLQHDPRITQIGRVLRRTSLDELPQLWNVLRGDMSLVGPRPMMDCQRSIYPGSAYYALRPGITGYWQTSVRNDSSFAERAEFDLAYLRDLSLATDVKLLVRTVKVVATGTGY